MGVIGLSVNHQRRFVDKEYKSLGFLQGSSSIGMQSVGACSGISSAGREAAREGVGENAFQTGGRNSTKALPDSSADSFGLSMIEGSFFNFASNAGETVSSASESFKGVSSPDSDEESRSRMTIPKKLTSKIS